MAIWALLGSLVSTVAGLTGYVIWRKRRQSSYGDRSAGLPAALEAAERQNADRHGIQGATW